MSDSIAFDKYCEELKEEIENYNGKNKEIIRELPKLLNLLVDLLSDIKIPNRERLWINAAIAYVISPYDVVPESIRGSAGFSDDAFLCLHVLLRLKESLGRDIIEDTWEGEEDIISLIENLYEKSTRWVGEKEKKSILRYAGLDKK